MFTPWRHARFVGAIAATALISGCLEPSQPKPKNPEALIQSDNCRKTAPAPVNGTSRRDRPEGEDGYGYEFENDPLAAPYPPTPCPED